MEIHELHKNLLSKSKSEKLSLILPEFIILCHKLNAIELRKWAELEYNGYFNTNPSLSEETEVPEYRTIAGIFKDKYERPLYIEDPELAFANTIRIRHGVGELEVLTEKQEELAIVDSELTGIIKRHLKVEVHKFTFSNSSIISVLDNIRMSTIKNLINLESFIDKLGIENRPLDTMITDIDILHPKIKETVGKLFKDGHYRQTILDTYILLVEYVKIKSGVYDLDNTPLMQKVFSQKNPIIKVSGNDDEQLGFMWMFSGAVMGIRNPNSHRLINHPDRQKTFEWLCFASVLLRTIDEAEVCK